MALYSFCPGRGSGPSPNGKSQLKRLIIVTAAAIGALILILGGLFLLAYYKGLGSGAKPVVVPDAAPYIQPTATSLVSPSPTPSSPGSPVPQQTPTPVLGSTPTLAPVAFSLTVQESRPAEISVFLSVSVKVFLHSELSNLGDFTAHNVNVSARARVGKDYVAIDGKEALVVSIGTVASRSTVPKDLTFTLGMSLSQGQTAQSQGIYFEVVVTSTEGNSYIPLMLCNQTACSPD